MKWDAVLLGLCVCSWGVLKKIIIILETCLICGYAMQWQWNYMYYAKEGAATEILRKERVKAQS